MNTAASSKLHRVALLGAVAFAVLHVFALPLLMTFDGAEYVKLGLGWPRNFPDGWDFGRTPLYPLAVRLSFWLLGRNALAAMFPNVVAGLIGIWSLAAAVRRLDERLGLAVLALLSLYPTLIVYEHAILTEAGSFMFLALLANWSTWRPAEVRRKTVALVLGTIAIFSFRPTSLVVVPLALILLAVERVAAERAGPDRKSWTVTARRVAPHLLVVGLAAALLSMSWNRARTAWGGRDYNGQQIFYGLLKQVVLPPEDPVVAPVREAYLSAIENATVEGSLDPGGLRRERHFPIYATFLEDADPRGALVRAVTTYPGRYAAGVGRALLLSLGAASIDSENESYFQTVVVEAHTGAKLWIPAGQLPAELEASFHQATGKSAVAGLIRALGTPFRWLLLLGALMSVLGLGLGIGLRSSGLVAITAIPLYWIVVHALTLMSSDRLVVPAHAFLVVNAIVVPVLLYRARRPTAP